jgi:hypothetical protein
MPERVIYDFNPIYKAAELAMYVRVQRNVSHPIFRRKPNASHMCARIKFTHI